MGIETVMAQANAAIKKNDPSAAFALLYDCRLHMTDPRAKALMTAALVASNKQASYNSDQVQRDVKKARKQRGVNIGMTEQEVLDSSWGRPEKVNTTTNAYGSTAQWVYHGNYLYFENGLLRTIQN